MWTLMCELQILLEINKNAFLLNLIKMYYLFFFLIPGSNDFLKQKNLDGTASGFNISFPNDD